MPIDKIDRNKKPVDNDKNKSNNKKQPVDNKKKSDSIFNEQAAKSSTKVSHKDIKTGEDVNKAYGNLTAKDKDGKPKNIFQKAYDFAKNSATNPFSSKVSHKDLKTGEDINNAYENFFAKDSGGKPKNIFQKAYDFTKNIFTKFADTAGFKPGINHEINDFMQGSVGNCSLLAACLALRSLRNHKQIMKDMIKENSDGTYTVRFPGAKDRPIRITKNDIMNAPSVVRGRASGKWDGDVGAIEVAMGQLKNGQRSAYSPPEMLRLLTGKDVMRIKKSDLPKLSKDQIDAAVAHHGGHALKPYIGKDGKYHLRNPHNTTRPDDINYERQYLVGLYTIKDRNIV